jgi:LmbE family N-acetylglucosaminyl deacetylase
VTSLAPSIHPHSPASLTVGPLGTILGVWAHPDDEAYLSSGVMAAAAANGQRVVVAHATLGEQGAPDPGACPPSRMARIRRRELTRSLRAVDVREHHLLGHPDGGCDQVDDDLAASQVAELIDTIRPDTILTFGPDGLTGHPDHRAVSRWVHRAWEATARSARLLHATVTTDWAARHRALNEQIGAFEPGLPRAVGLGAVAVQLTLDERLLDRKVAALRAHRSQTTGLEQAMGPATYRRWWATESFVEVSG